MRDKQNLNLDQVVTYQIKVPGLLDEQRAYWNEEMVVVAGKDDDDLPISTLTTTVDQAALQALLRRLYSLGLPLISVVCIDYKSDESCVVK